MAVVSMHRLLEAGAHFGHQARKWHPNMRPYIFAERNGIHIINLQQTIVGIRTAFQAVRQVVLERKQVLFVATKKQAQKVIEEEAIKCGMPYVNQRWLGGILTNFVTLQQSTNKLRQYEKMEVDGTFKTLSRKEFSRISKKKNSLEKNLGGVKEMNSLPGMLFIIDPVIESIAVAEARKKNIPIVAVTDTDCDPSLIQYPIPGNDDAIRAISLFTQIISQAVIDADNEIGLEIIETLQSDGEEVGLKRDESTEKAEISLKSNEEPEGDESTEVSLKSDSEKVGLKHDESTEKAEISLKSNEEPEGDESTEVSLKSDGEKVGLKRDESTEKAEISLKSNEEPEGDESTEVSLKSDGEKNETATPTEDETPEADESDVNRE